MSSDNVENGIKGIIANGINLKLDSAEEENYYVLQMCDFFNNETEFKAYITGVHSFEIEIDRSSPVMEVIIKDSLLFIVPYTEDVFEAFAEMLGFIAKNHEKIL